VHSFFTLESAVALYQKLKYFKKGKMVFNIAEMPHKCPVVPMEFIFMADWFFAVNGVRDSVEIEFVTPNTGIFTKPIATSVLSVAAEEKKINVVPNFHLVEVNQAEGYLESATGEQASFDLLVSTMPNLGADYVEDSGLGDGMGYVLTDNYTLKAEKWDNIYVVGDATNVPTSKAGYHDFCTGNRVMIFWETYLAFDYGNPSRRRAAIWRIRRAPYQCRWRNRAPRICG
jgi:sulfide:quinone oxidoreductase